MISPSTIQVISPSYTSQISNRHVARHAWTVSVDKNVCKKSRAASEQEVPNIPGFKKILSPQNGLVTKAVWSLVLLGSVLLCGYQIVDRVSLYLRRPIASETLMQRNDTVKFPSFTLCPVLRNIPKLAAYKTILANKRGLNNFCLIKDYEIVGEEIDLEEYWNLANLEDFISVRVTSETEIFIGAPPLLPLNITHRFFPYGNCTTYSITDPINFKGDDIMFVVIGERFDQKTMCLQALGFTYFMHEDFDDVRYIIEKESLVGFNKFMKFGIRAQQFKSINSKAKPCFTQEQLNKCQSKCAEKVFLKTNICKLPFLDNKQDFRECNSGSDVANSSLDIMQILTDINYYKDCKCRPKCYETIYSTNMKSFTKLPGTTNILLFFYFEDNAINVIYEYYSYSLISLFCDIGGNLGLFLGLSIPSILELLQGISSAIRKTFSR